LSYAGFLPGYTMGYNYHGLVYSINTLNAAVLRSGKIRESLQFRFFFLETPSEPIDLILILKTE
jgi:hypothetical protein